MPLCALAGTLKSYYWTAAKGLIGCGASVLNGMADAEHSGFVKMLGQHLAADGQAFFRLAAGYAEAAEGQTGLFLRVLGALGGSPSDRYFFAIDRM